MRSHGGGWRADGVHGLGILDCPPFLILGMSVLVLLGPVAVSSLLRFSDGMSGAMILVVIFQVEIPMVPWRFPSCLGNGIIGLDVGEFGEV